MAEPRQQHVIESGAWSAWLDGELGPAERARVETHLAGCAECRSVAAEWNVVHERLAAYEPLAAPEQAEAFWARLAPQLAATPRPRPDPVLYLAPAALALAWLVCQGLAIAWAIVGPLGGWQALAVTWRYLASIGLWLVNLGGLRPDWSAALAQGLGQAGGWMGPGSLWMLVGEAATWTVAAALAVLYAAWIVLWLRRPAQASEVLQTPEA